MLFSGALAGCTATSANYPNVAWAGSETAYVLFTAPAFKDTSSKHIVFTDMWQHEEYVLFQGNGAQAEIIYVAANERDTIALDYNLPVVPMVKTWNIANAHPVVWGEKGQTGAPLGAYFYQHFRLSDVGRDCVGFFTEWDLKDDDPQLRNGKVVFGYYCEKPGVILTQAGIFNLLDNIWIRGITARFDTRFSPVAPVGSAGRKDLVALAFAQRGSGNTGNANFPFDMADFYSDVDGEDDRRN
ncbi:MAG: hypothetical protein GKS00_23170 [Alphaproteobacteria bacterium]|nr:hypothetical protein [Alphaproteobacteria bacterium]